jgi:DNA-binding transcriptional LysR family regulator
MDRLQSMRVFQAVADEGGFAAASRKLDLAPAIVTRLVADLERHIGARLLQRTTRRVALTPAGEAYLARLRAILSDIDEADALAQAESKVMRGTIRVLSWPVFANQVVAPAAVEFQRLHPEVHLIVQAESVTHPNVEDYDVCFMLGSVHFHPSVIVRTIGEGQAFLCATPKYLDAHGRPQTPDDLKHHRFLRTATQATRPPPMTLIDPTDGDRTIVVDVNPVLTSNSVEMVQRALMGDGGIAPMPGLLAGAAIASGKLERVLAPWIASRPTVVAALPSRAFMPARTRAFLDHLAGYTERLRTGKVR